MSSVDAVTLGADAERAPLLGTRRLGKASFKRALKDMSSRVTTREHAPVFANPLQQSGNAQRGLAQLIGAGRGRVGEVEEITGQLPVEARGCKVERRACA